LLSAAGLIVVGPLFIALEEVARSMSRAGGARVARRQLSIWSKRDFGELDQRLLEAKEERRLIRLLTEHVGRPSIVQELMIRRAARLLIVIGLLERRVIERPDELGDLACRQLVAFHNALRLTFAALGMEKAEQSATLKGYLGGKAA
jgi:hypothetical protein